MNVPTLEKKEPAAIYIWLFCGLVLATICWLVSGNYFSLDEPNLLWDIRGHHAGRALLTKYVAEGRPFDGVITIGLQRIIGSLAGLRYMRMLNVLLVFLFCFQIFKQLEKTKLGKEYAFLVSAMVFCLPSLSVFICWAECTSLLFSAILSFYAGTLAIKALGKHLGQAEQGLKKERLFVASAIFLQILSLMDYQSLALAFALPAFFCLLTVENVATRNKIWFTFLFACIYFSSIFLYMRCYDFLLSTLHIEKVARGTFTDRPLEKLSWYAHILSEASKLHLLLIKTSVLPILFSGLLLLAIGRDLYLKRFSAIFFLFVFCTLVFFPHLLIRDSWGASRNFGLIAILLTFYLLLHISELVRFRSYGIIAIVSLIFAGLMCLNIQEGWASPQVSDSRQLSTFMKNLPEVKSEKLIIEVRLPEWDMHEKSSALKAYFDEFNDPIFFRGWAVEPAIKIMYQDRFPAMQASKIDSIVIIKIPNKSSAFSAEPAPGTYRLDLNHQ